SLGAALAATLLGKDALAAINAAQMVDTYNRQLHPDQLKAISELAKKGGGKAEDLTAVLCVLQNCDINGLSGVDANMQEVYRAGAEMLKSNPALFEELASSIYSAGLLSGEFEYRLGGLDFMKDAFGLRLQNSIYTPFDKATTRPESWADWLTGAAKGLGNLNPDLQVPAPTTNIDEERGAIWGAATGMLAAAVAGRMAGLGGVKGAGNLADGELAASKVKWVDERAGMSRAARDYNDSATGARSNPVTQSGQAPVLERTMPDGTTRQVKFDGVDGDVMIDRKISIVTTDKAKDQALRQSEALSQNGLAGRWEVSSDAQAARAIKMFNDLGIKNIQVKVVKQ
ncbi:hypothetical protein, partial [Azonexus hydrophilus]|uniref:hypothetical protein n=1 Tax=Azonexus hydrophilus TaxID=418702 RepID=UPI00196661CC